MDCDNNSTCQGASPRVPGSADASPHVLWLQALAIAASTVVFMKWMDVFTWVGPLAVLAGIFVFLDAWGLGIYSRKSRQTVFSRLSPVMWGIAVQGLIHAGFPFYLANRQRLRTRKCTNAYWILAMVFTALYFLPYFAQVMTNMGQV